MRRIVLLLFTIAALVATAIPAIAADDGKVKRFAQAETLGYYRGNTVAYLDFGPVKLARGNKVAPIWAFTNGAEGQRNVIDTVPGRSDYTPLWARKARHLEGRADSRRPSLRGSNSPGRRCRSDLDQGGADRRQLPGAVGRRTSPPSSSTRPSRASAATASPSSSAPRRGRAETSRSVRARRWRNEPS